MKIYELVFYWEDIYNGCEITVDEVDPIVLTNYKIRNIPVLVLLQDNKEVWRHVGSISKVELEDKIKEYEAN